MASRVHSKPSKKKKTVKPVEAPVDTKPAVSRKPAITKLPRSFRLMREVFTLLRSRGRLFGGLVLVIWSLVFIIVGSTQQLQYESLRDLAKLVSDEVYGGNYSVLVETGVLITSIAGGGLNSILGEGQQIYLVLIYIFAGLVTVWLLRHVVAGSAVRLRDGLYAAGAPVAAIVVLGVIGAVQLIPFVVGTLMASAANASGLLDNPWLAVGFYTLWLVSAVASLYLLMTTFFAAIIATIPGTYPVQAFRDAHRLLSGKRLAVFVRIIWLVIVAVLVMILFVAPVIFVDTIINSEWVPLVAALLQLISVSLLVFCVSYIYLLYRKLIDASTRS